MQGLCHFLKEEAFITLAGSLKTEKETIYVDLSGAFRGERRRGNRCFFLLQSFYLTAAKCVSDGLSSSERGVAVVAGVVRRSYTGFRRSRATRARPVGPALFVRSYARHRLA